MRIKRAYMLHKSTSGPYTVFLAAKSSGAKYSGLPHTVFREDPAFHRSPSPRSETGKIYKRRKNIVARITDCSPQIFSRVFVASSNRFSAFRSLKEETRELLGARFEPKMRKSTLIGSKQQRQSNDTRHGTKSESLARFESLFIFLWNQLRTDSLQRLRS